LDGIFIDPQFGCSASVRSEVKTPSRCISVSSDQLGRLQGLVIDGIDHHVTDVLIDAGHLGGEKRVAIPISAVTGVDNGIYLNLTKDEVRDLLQVGSDHSAQFRPRTITLAAALDRSGSTSRRHC